MHIKRLAAFVSVALISFSASSASDPTYDCTALETNEHMLSMTQALFASSPISSASDFKTAFVEQKIEEAEQGGDDASSCASIFTDGTLDDSWKDIIDQLRNLDVSFNFASLEGAAMELAIDLLKEKLREAQDDMFESLGQDICSMMSSDYLSSLALDKANEAFGTSASELKIKSFADSLTDDAMDDAPENIQVLMSEAELNSTFRYETQAEINELREDLWDKF